MTGVEILNQYVVASNTAFNIWVFVGILAFCIVAGLLIIIFGDFDFPLLIPFILIGVLMGGMGGAIAGVVAPNLEHQITRYEVTIDDTVSMNDFYDKYEVIEQRGKIYIVEEREQ